MALLDAPPRLRWVVSVELRERLSGDRAQVPTFSVGLVVDESRSAHGDPQFQRDRTGLRQLAAGSAEWCAGAHGGLPACRCRMGAVNPTMTYRRENRKGVFPQVEGALRQESAFLQVRGNSEHARTLRGVGDEANPRSRSRYQLLDRHVPDEQDSGGKQQG